MTVRTKSILLGILSALFFAATFVLNRSMSLTGGSWIWSAAFRYYWMLVLLLPILLARKELLPLLRTMSKQLAAWLLWSTVGFGMFYGGLTYAASFAPGWLLASTWQITIIAGMCLAPFISPYHEKLSWKTIFFSLIILFGVFILQIPQAKSVSTGDLLKSILPVLLAAFAYPLGNRKMMQLTQGKLSALQRLFGMTLASVPFWIVLSLYGVAQESLPDQNILLQTFFVAMLSGVAATWLFFKATDMVRNDQKRLAAVEATQSTEVIFALAGEVVILHAAVPDWFSLVGIAIVILGMLLHSSKS